MLYICIKKTRQMDETKTNFRIIGIIKNITSEHQKTVDIEVEEAFILTSDEKEVIKTFSHETLIQECSRRYGAELVINTIK